MWLDPPGGPEEIVTRPRQCAARATTVDHDANGNLTVASDGFHATYNALNQTASVDPPGTPGAFTLAYADRGQAERAGKGSTNFTDTVLGTTIDQAGTTTVNFVRDEKGKLVAQRTNSSGTITRRYPALRPARLYRRSRRRGGRRVVRYTDKNGDLGYRGRT